MKKILCIGLLAGMCCALARGQQTLTLDQCIALARQYGPRLRMVENRVRSAGFARDELLTTRLPQVRLGASPIYAPFGRKFGYDPALSNGGQIVGQILLQQSLFDGGIRTLKSDQIANDIERLGREYRLADRDLRFSVQQSFFETLRSAQEVVLERESLRQLTDYADLVRRIHSGGAAAYTDVLKADLQVSGERMVFQKAVDEYAVNKYTLAELIGNPIDTSFSVEGSWEPPMPVPNDSLARDANLDSLVYLEVSVAGLELKSRILEVEMAERERWPVISLAADAGYANSGGNLDLGPAERFSALGFSLGIVVDLPLINWGATGLRVQQREAAVDALRLESNILRRSLITETKKTRLQLIRSRERLRAIRQNTQNAEENFLLTKSRFAGGGGLAFEVLAAQQTLRETRLAELRTLADIRILGARLEQLTTQ